MYSGKLKIDRKLYEARKERLRKMMAINAPDVVIHTMAHHLLKSFDDPLRDRWTRWLYAQPHGWLTWLFSPAYREMCREPIDEEFEQEMRTLLKESKR